MKEETKIQLKVDLFGSHVQWFNQLKTHLGLRNNSEIIRYLIYSGWQTEVQKDDTYIRVPKILLQEINVLLARPDIKQKYLLNSADDLIVVALRDKVHELRAIQSNILQWDVRSQLPDNEKEVAVGFLKAYQTSITKQIFVKEVAKIINRQNLTLVEDILDRFVARGQLYSNIEEDSKFYYIE